MEWVAAGHKKGRASFDLVVEEVEQAPGIVQLCAKWGGWASGGRLFATSKRPMQELRRGQLEAAVAHAR